jgi:hypothetical protein
MFLSMAYYSLFARETKVKVNKLELLQIKFKRHQKSSFDE